MLGVQSRNNSLSRQEILPRGFHLGEYNLGLTQITISNIV